MFGLMEGASRRPFDLFNTFPSLFAEEGWSEYPLMNVWAGADELVVTSELPGIDPGKIDVSVSGDTLTISGEREMENSKDDRSWLRRERLSGSFTRSLKLPYHIDAAKVRAEYSLGVLKLLLPRVEEEKPRKIVVTVS